MKAKKFDDDQEDIINDLDMSTAKRLIRLKKESMWIFLRGLLTAR